MFHSTETLIHMYAHITGVPVVEWQQALAEIRALSE